MSKTLKIGRSAKSGRFVPVAKAKSRASTHVVETIKRPCKAKKK